MPDTDRGEKNVLDEPGVQSDPSRIQTVLGPVPASAIGFAMFHEHVLFDIVSPTLDGERGAEIRLEDRWQIDYLSNRLAANGHQRVCDVAVAELEAYRGDGGSLIVDQTVWGLARNPTGLVEASRRSGVHIVAATGSYTFPYLHDDIRSLGRAALADRILRELTEGMDGTDIRAGVIGEIGCSWPLEPCERRALEAAADAQGATGVTICVHPGRDRRACPEILNILEDAGADFGRTVLCHMDRTYPDGDGILPLLERGVNVEWDFFGIEQSHYWMGDVELPADLGRLRLIAEFAALGYGSNILISHDICTKTRMQRWGGHGYGHILRNVVGLMDRLHFDPGLKENLLRTNPLRLLATGGEDG